MGKHVPVPANVDDFERITSFLRSKTRARPFCDRDRIFEELSEDEERLSQLESKNEKPGKQLQILRSIMRKQLLSHESTDDPLMETAAGLLQYVIELTRLRIPYAEKNLVLQVASRYLESPDAMREASSMVRHSFYRENFDHHRSAICRVLCLSNRYLDTIVKNHM